MSENKNIGKIEFLEVLKTTLEGQGKDISKDDILSVFETTFEQIKKFASEGVDVNFQKFGSFITKTTKERNARNIKTGETIKVPAKTKVAFKVSPKWKEEIEGK